MKKRLGDYLLAFVIILALNFILPRLMPGDPLTAIYGDALVEMTPEMESYLLERYGLDRPLGEQFAVYLGNLARGDLGYSFYFRAPVAEVLVNALPWTILLVGTSLVAAAAVGIIWGVEAGWRRGRKFDRYSLTAALFLNGIPGFLLGILLLLALGFYGQWFPLSGGTSPFPGQTLLARTIDILWHLFLPALTLTLAQLPRNFLLMRSTFLAVIKEPYVLTARGKGIKERLIRYRHCLRSALPPVVTRIGMSIGLLFTGVLFVEVVFAYPGLGHLFYLALQHHDYPTVHGCLLLITVCVLIFNLLADLISMKLDPRLKEDAHKLLG